MAKKKKKAGPKLNTVSVADQVRLGADVAAAKASMTPATWKQIVSSAHKGGYTVSGVLSGAPEALRPRLQSSLKDEAAKSVADAYKPVLADLDSQETRVKAWDAKRADDNKAYSAWLATQNQALAATNAGATSQLLAAHVAARDGVKQAWDAIQQGTTANTKGGVSDPSQSSALAQIPVAAAAANGQANSNLEAATANLKAGGDSTAETLANINGSFAASGDASRRADISQALSSIRDSRTQTTIKKAGDYLSEFARLKGGEVTKAQNLMDSQIAANKLDVDLQKFHLDEKKVNHTIATDSRKDKNGATSAAASAEQARIAAGKLALDKGKADLDGDGKLTSKDYDLRKKIDAKYSKTGSGTSKGDESYSRTLSDQLSRTFTALIGLHSDYKRDPAKGKKTGHTPDRFPEILGKRNAKQELITLAEDARRNHGKLSPWGIRKAKALGILNPEAIDLS